MAAEAMSSSGTRLTNEFRYLLDMINIVFRVGWFRAVALRAGQGVGVKAWPVGRPRSGVALAPTPVGASWWWRGRPFGVANAPCSLDRSCRIACIGTIRPSMLSCTASAMIATSTLRPRHGVSDPTRPMVSPDFARGSALLGAAALLVPGRLRWSRLHIWLQSPHPGRGRSCQARRACVGWPGAIPVPYAG
jgi:hypothetical protein